jgi:transcriptional regulator with PAS, ATPase and Fis domain
VTNGGTIFLDEIGEMPQNTQARLLRVLEYGEFIKVGSSKVQKSDVRVLAATNIDLHRAVEKGEFREDLFYRLNTVPIFVPPLRERGEDIILLFRKFASDFSEKYRTKPIMLTEDGKETLLNYRFPGNIRQLKNLVEQISILETDKSISSEILLKYLPREQNLIPALYENKNDQGISERELLYKILFEMRRDVTELKKLVHGIISDDNIDTESLKEHTSIIKRLESEEETIPSNKSAALLINPNTETSEKFVYSNVEDISHEPESEESLSLEHKEKEMIIKALKKNNNKRKYAAKDLGISERTLYRKIKQFEIEE